MSPVAHREASDDAPKGDARKPGRWLVEIQLEQVHAVSQDALALAGTAAWTAPRLPPHAGRPVWGVA